MMKYPVQKTFFQVSENSNTVLM